MLSDSPESLSYSISSGSSPSSITSTSSDTLRRNRTSFSRRQLAALEALFSTNSYPNNFQREKIAAETGLNHSKIQVLLKHRHSFFQKQKVETIPFQHYFSGKLFFCTKVVFQQQLFQFLLNQCFQQQWKLSFKKKIDEQRA